MSKADKTAIIRAIQKRTLLDAKVAKVNACFQPRLDKITEARDKKTSTNRAKIRDLTTLIKSRIYALNGGELSELRRTYPALKELL